MTRPGEGPPPREPIGPLRRTERFLAARMVHIERQLPPEGTDHVLWAEYRETARLYLECRALLYGRRPAA
jgi:hypothetical protein